MGVVRQFHQGTMGTSHRAGHEGRNLNKFQDTMCQVHFAWVGSLGQSKAGI